LAPSCIVAGQQCLSPRPFSPWSFLRLGTTSGPLVGSQCTHVIRVPSWRSSAEQASTPAGRPTTVNDRVAGPHLRSLPASRQGNGRSAFVSRTSCQPRSQLRRGRVRGRALPSFCLELFRCEPLSQDAGISRTSSAHALRSGGRTSSEPSENHRSIRTRTSAARSRARPLTSSRLILRGSGVVHAHFSP
jgi:hypothetical protein